MKQPNPNIGVTSAPPLHAEPIQPPGSPAAGVSADTTGQDPDQPLAEGAQGEIDAELRHRMISEAAYHLYEQRGYAEGYEMDDWLQAEAALERLLLHRKTSKTSVA
jgi:hypothetical protein